MLTAEQIHKIIDDLQLGGLVSSIRTKNGLDIIGGTEKRDAKIFSVYRNGFTISCENDMWVCRLPGKGQTSVEKTVPDIYQAVKLVCEYYQALPQDFFD